MTAFAIGTRAQPLRIGRALVGALRELQRHGLILLGFSVIFVGLPDLGISYAEHLLLSAKFDPTIYGLLLLGDRVIALLTESWLYAAAFHLAIRPADAGPSTWLAAVAFAARSFWAVFIARLAGVALMIGLPTAVLIAVVAASRSGAARPPDPVAMLLAETAAAFPGAVLFVCWSLAPALVAADGRGPIAALGRSWRLTTGSRLQIGALMLLYLIAVAFLAVLVLVAITASRGFITAGWAVTASLGVCTALPASVMAAAGLVGIWRELAGPAPESVAAMFD